MYLQDSKLFRVCQVRNEDIEMSCVALCIIYTTCIYTYPINNSNLSSFQLELHNNFSYS